MSASPLAEAPTASAAFSVDRAVDELEAELSALPLAERFAVRGDRIIEAEEAARRASLDEGGDVTVTLLAIRERMAEAPEAAEEYAAAEQARIDRNQSFGVTEQDRRNAAIVADVMDWPEMMVERADQLRLLRQEDIEGAAAHVDTPERGLDRLAQPAEEREEAHAY